MNEEIKERLDRIENYAQIAAKSVLNINEAAFILGMQPRTVRKMVLEHTIPVYKPNRSVLYFKKSDLENWMLKNRIASSEEIESEAASYCETH